LCTKHAGINLRRVLLRINHWESRARLGFTQPLGVNQGREKIFVLSQESMQHVTLPSAERAARLWMPRRVLFTPKALAEPWGRQIYERVAALGLPIEELRSNRLTGLRGDDERSTYNLAKRTLAVVTAPPSALKLQPIPPSADWQFHLAEGCPAHCQYCYLAGSLQGPPVVRAFANLPAILANLAAYEQPQRLTTFEASCYTDPLSIEHLTGSLAESIRYFGTRQQAALRWVTKFAAIEPLLALPHNGQTRCRFSVNAEPISRRLEGGTSPVAERLRAMRRLALPRSRGGGGYPVGLVIAPIMPIDDWQVHYTRLFDAISETLDFACDLTFELISHRFTPGSRDVLLGWYPNTSLEMDETTRTIKRNKFGGIKYVYPQATMQELRQFFQREIARRFPQAELLYWT
jgi:spore photoproduct lyase